MSKNWEKQQAKILGQRKANNMWKDVGKHISEGISKICKEAVHQRDNGGLLEEEVRAPARGMAAAAFTIDCREDVEYKCIMDVFTLSPWTTLV